MDAAFLVAAAAALITAAACALLLLSPLRRAARDLPSHRSLHDAPVPRLGGIAIVCGVAAGCALASATVSWLLQILATPVLLLFFTSLWDDLGRLSAGVRLVFHTLAAALFLGLGPLAPIGMLLLSLVLLIWAINLFNFMDGSNGLAGGMAVIGFSTLALASSPPSYTGSHDIALATLSIAVASASFAFLFFNFGRARLFMGDAGSTVLGFLAASLGILGVHRGLWPFWFPVIVFSPFIVDATATLVKRGLRGEKIWQAHRSHYYQRVILMGSSHTRLALSEYALMVACAGAALLALHNPGLRALIFSSLALLYIALMTIVDYHWSKHLRKAGAHV